APAAGPAVARAAGTRGYELRPYTRRRRWRRHCEQAGRLELTSAGPLEVALKICEQVVHDIGRCSREPLESKHRVVPREASRASAFRTCHLPSLLFLSE